MRIDMLEETRKQREQREREALICNAYKELRRQFPEASGRRIYDTIAKKVGMTLEGVYGILRRRGAIERG